MATATENARPLYLNGQWTRPRDPVDVVNPSNGEVIGRVATAGREEVDQALRDAQAAWPAWRALTGKQRGQYLRAVADAIEARRDTIARTMTLENGKPLKESQGELNLTIDHLQWFAEEARRGYGRIVPHQKDNKRHLVVESPVGVVGAISPWNFPLVLAVRKAAPALAAGCPVVLKPATATPLCCVALAEAVEAAGLPAGVFQLVAGSGREIGGAFLNNPICRKITFTGSTEVGRELIRAAAASVKKLSLELGGHAPVLVFDDADLDTAVEGTVAAKFRNTGQSCIAANRVFVQRSIYDRFLEKLVERTKAMKVGDGLEDGVEIGPLIDDRGVETALTHIQEAQKDGARVVCGGERAGKQGSFIQPTILVDVPDDARCMQEETFAPVAPVTVFDDEASGIQRANNSIYGLAAYAFTNDLSRMWRLAEHLEAGTIGINDGVPSTSQCPFGGLKQSGWGRELGSEGMEAFLETKHVSLGVQA